MAHGQCIAGTIGMNGVVVLRLTMTNVLTCDRVDFLKEG